MHEKLAVRKGGFDTFLEEQKRGASGQRLEMLGRDLTGTRKLAEEVLLPVFGSLDGFVLEYELISLSGVKIYVDAFYPPLLAAFESDGFVSHAERLTRDRFSFERMRMRTVSMHGLRFVPFSYDELDKKPETCIRTVYELLGRYGSSPVSRLYELPVYEREVLRFALSRNGVFTLNEAGECLRLKRVATSRLLHRMVNQKLLLPLGKGSIRYSSFVISEKGKSYFMAGNLER
ncbi:helix-turn-helix domain-containing protein [Cohnella zeiphila]|uniref:Uncharacterized protein n=1 Tax=Cohnella zeiphila TaxID=2761120 RepID=A0A7X0VVI0_9BACL|nr:helix-turn-helix domain-containing protein [Cohnella zeiphila]MBB6732174.1 hypothetical protein [Cohnella zeiphila]